MRWKSATCLALVISILPSAFAIAAEPYHDDIHHFSFTPPDGWKEQPKDFINAMSKVLSKQSNLKISYLAQFNPTDQSSPYLVIQTSGDHRGSLDQFLRSLTPQNLDEGFQKAKGLVQNASFGHPWIDEKRQAVLMTVEMDGLLVGRMKALTAIFPGRRGAITFNLYSTPKEYEKDLPLFGTILDSFQYDPGFGYVEPVLWKKWDFNFSAGTAVVAVIIGAAIMFLFKVGKRFFTRKPSSAENGDPLKPPD